LQCEDYKKYVKLQCKDCNIRKHFLHLHHKNHNTMNLIQYTFDLAKSQPQRIVLPEGAEPRTLTAADRAADEGLADIIVIGKTSEIQEKAKELNLKNLSKITIFDPEQNPKQNEYINLLYELRKSKGITIEEAKELAKDPFYIGCLMIKNGDADGEVGGASSATSRVLRPAFQIIKTKPGVSVVSGAMLMFTDKKEFGENGLLIFADCAVNPMPNAKELAEIAVSTGHTARNIAKFEPRIAMLSFSTKGSSKNEWVEPTVTATQLAKEMAPDMQIDGELQSDAALVPYVGAIKAPESKIAGRANVLIFPDLRSGNIAYKLVQRLSNTEAIGPILQGIAAPVNDLSRGCSVDDIVKMIAITSVQAIEGKKETVAATIRG
jgi:phosphate acetyltransferase